MDKFIAARKIARPNGCYSSWMVKGLRHLEMARHPDERIGLKRFTKYRLRLLTITGCVAIEQHHCVEALYLRFFENVGKGLGLIRRDLKMLFRGFPLMRPSRRETGDCLRES